jgi:hypothetical protein
MTLASTMGVVASLLQGAVAIFGLFLAVQAYRGYLRHGVSTMRYLAWGIALLTFVPIGLSYGSIWIGGIPDALSLLSVGVAYLLGLGALDYAFNYASE